MKLKTWFDVLTSSDQETDRAYSTASVIARKTQRYDDKEKVLGIQICFLIINKHVIK